MGNYYIVEYRFKDKIDLLTGKTYSEKFDNLGDCISFLGYKYLMSKPFCLGQTFEWRIKNVQTGKTVSGYLEIKKDLSFIEQYLSIDINQFQIK